MGSSEAAIDAAIAALWREAGLNLDEPQCRNGTDPPNLVQAPVA